MRVQTRGFRMGRAGVVLVTVFGLVAGAVTPVTAIAAVEQSERARTLELVRTGGELVVKAASAALVGTDEQVHKFIAEDYPVIAEHDDRIKLTRMMATAGSAVRNAANTAMSGSIEDVRAFLNTGYQEPWRNDQYQLVNKIIARGGAKTKQAGQAALNGTFDDVLRFINTGQYAAAEHDDRMAVNKIVATSAEGSNVYVAAQRALDGTIDDVREFLRSGWQVAAQRDQETMTVAALATLADAEQRRAAEQTDAAKEASDQAVLAAEKAKAAALKAAQEADAARNDSAKAAQAASRAATAAQGAAAAAQTAINAAGRANQAAKVAANAAGQAAIAASMTERAAGRAHDAAAAAASDAGRAHDARVAAEAARDVAKTATAAAAASDAAGKAVTEAGKASGAATSASSNADLAAKHAEDAAAAARAAGANAQEAEQAAARARAAAAEARRAASTSQSLAGQAAKAAFDARDAANGAAAHARAAADAADEAANHAGEAEKAAERSAAAAAEADKAAVAAKKAADQAHLVAKTSRDADAERLEQAKSQGVRDAQDAVVEEGRTRDKITWTPGKRETFDAETDRLLTEARKPDAPVTTGRQAAMRLLTRGGPWVASAAEQALSGNEFAVRSLLARNLAFAVEQDDRASVGIIGRTTTIPKQRDASLVAERGSYDVVKEFLRTKDYPGKREADRQEVNRVMAAAGSSSVVYAKGNEALNAELAGNANALHEFLETGRFAAALHDDRKAVNKAYEQGGDEVKAVAQAALSGPDSYLAKFLLLQLPNAQVADADAAKHVAVIDGYLAKADQSAALARENANKAAEWAAIAKKAAEEAAQWRDKAAASAAEAKESARQAQSHAEAAQRSADQAAASAKRAREAAAQAQKSANAASASAASASASAATANHWAAEAKKSADAARKSADEAHEDAKKAQEAADAAIEAAGRFASTAEQQRNAGDVPKEADVSPFGIEYEPSDMKDDAREIPDSGTCWGTRAGGASCVYKVEHHITGTMRYFTFKCPPGATSKSQCERFEIGSVRIDFKVVKEHSVNTMEIAGHILLEFAKAVLSDFRNCATDKNLLSQAEACGWSAMAILPPGWIPRFGRIGVLAAKDGVKIGDDFLNIALRDGSDMATVLTKQGRLEIAIEVAEDSRSKGVGGDMVSRAFDQFAGQIKSVAGIWGTNMPSNLNSFNKNMKAGMSFEDAARGTFTGHMAGKYGFNKVIFVETKPPGAPIGEYTNVYVIFGPG
ncbi:ALF repeat-containing protein [Lentzea sp. NPDC051838]|uniref:ALF repeat-containing protein n=1 Tax=Lentzea sp. NPDC051838 TaxID=3154849 RepID=UPI0034473C50